MVIAGHNGAGKSTCYKEYLRDTLAPHLEFHIDPDAIEREIRADWSADMLTDDDFSRRAAEEAKRRRLQYVADGVAFSMETVLSDPVGDKLSFFRDTIRQGYLVALLAVGLDSPEKSRERVALRVSRGGHNVPTERILSRYPRVLANFSRAVSLVSIALMVDNSQDNFEDETGAYTAFAIFEGGLVESADEIPGWWRNVYPPLSNGSS